MVSWASASKDITSASRKEIDTSFFIHDSFRTEYSRETLLVGSFITFRSGHEWREVCGFELQQVCSLATLPVKHDGAVLRCSAGEFFLALSTYAVRGAALALAQGADIYIQLPESAAEGVAMHPQHRGRLALVPIGFPQSREIELLFEFPDGIGVGNACPIHL